MGIGFSQKVPPRIYSNNKIESILREKKFSSAYSGEKSEVCQGLHQFKGKTLGLLV